MPAGVQTGAGPIEVRPRPLRFGVLTAGQPAAGQLSVRWASNGPGPVVAIESSCPCIRVEPDQVSFADNRTHELAVIFDPAADADFRGGLAVELVARGPKGSAWPLTTVEFVIRDLNGPASAQD